jgi:hypothetical protein
MHRSATLSLPRPRSRRAGHRRSRISANLISGQGSAASRNVSRMRCSRAGRRSRRCSRPGHGCPGSPSASTAMATAARANRDPVRGSSGRLSGTVATTRFRTTYGGRRGGERATLSGRVWPDRLSRSPRARNAAVTPPGPGSRNGVIRCLRLTPPHKSRTQPRWRSRLALASPCPQASVVCLPLANGLVKPSRQAAGGRCRRLQLAGSHSPPSS